MITKKRAKALSLEIWGYLKDHPEIKSKTGLPDKLWNKISYMEAGCPLCQYHEEKLLPCKNNCPLDTAYVNCGWFFRWLDAKTKKARQKYATIIYDKINEWDITKRVKK